MIYSHLLFACPIAKVIIRGVVAYNFHKKLGFFLLWAVLAPWIDRCRCFFTPIRYRVVNITHSSFEVILWTIKYTVIYPNSDPSSEVIDLRLVVWYRRSTCVTRGEQRAREVHVMKGENESRTPAWRVGGFYRSCRGLLTTVLLLYK
jgi:hypothetical protein